MTRRFENYDSNFDPAELIKERLTKLGAVFNRKIKNEAVAVYQEALHGYPFHVLEQAFTQAFNTLERFPTPRTLRMLANEHMSARMNTPVLVCDLCSPDGWKLVEKDMPPAVYHLIGPNNKPTGETRIVPYKMAVRCDHLGQQTYFDDEEVFRAEDCPEGREFLAKLREVASKLQVENTENLDPLDKTLAPYHPSGPEFTEEEYQENLRDLATARQEAKLIGSELPLSPAEREALWLLKPLAVRKRFARMKARRDLLEE